MINLNILKSSLLSLCILYLNSCSHSENIKTAIVNADQSASSIIGNLQILSLNLNPSGVDVDKQIKLFLQGYNHVKTGKIIKAKDIFHDLLNGQKEAKEYGLYGLILISFETDNMSEMKKYIYSIENLENRTDWLSNELRKYKIYYHYNTANFDKAERLLDSVSMQELINSPFLSSIKSDLYIRNNQLDKAKEIFKQLEVDSELSISVEARLISITLGNLETVNYLKNMVNTYPDNEYLRLLYNQSLIHIDLKNAINNAYKLGLKTDNTYILAHSIELLFSDVTDSNTLERLNILNDKLNNLNAARDYIDYYLINVALPVNDKEMSINLAIANEFNSMNYYLLMHKYYVAADKDNQLAALKDLEKIDPYDNYILVELAQFYKLNAMTKELSDIKQRFRDSKRIKTEDEIEFINSL